MPVAHLHRLKADDYHAAAGLGRAFYHAFPDARAAKCGQMGAFTSPRHHRREATACAALRQAEAPCALMPALIHARARMMLALADFSPPTRRAAFRPSIDDDSPKPRSHQPRDYHDGTSSARASRRHHRA